MPGDRQLTLDWFRAQLAALQLPTTGGVSGDVLRAVLIAIYDLPAEAGNVPGRPCWAGQALIAARSGCKERTARRALQSLEHDLHLITSYRCSPPGARTRKTLDHYVIQWTDVGCLSDFASGVTRQSVTRPIPASRPGHGECDGDSDAARPVDRPARPVDRPARPVDRPARPVDRPAHTIPARADPDQVGSTLITATTFSPDPERTELADWAAVAAVLRRAGVGSATKRVDELRASGIAPETALEQVRWIVRVGQSPKNAWRWTRSSASAIAYRISTGDWPEEVDEDVDDEAANAATTARADKDRWESLITDAYRRVRAETPAGRYVDEGAVVDAAISLGVPRPIAEVSRGLNAGVVEQRG